MSGECWQIQLIIGCVLARIVVSIILDIVHSRREHRAKDI